MSCSRNPDFGWFCKEWKKFLAKFADLQKRFDDLLAQIGTQGGRPDTEMSDISENAVQNRVIKSYVDNLRNLTSRGFEAQGNINRQQAADNETFQSFMIGQADSNTAVNDRLVYFSKAVGDLQHDASTFHIVDDDFTYEELVPLLSDPEAKIYFLLDNTMIPFVGYDGGLPDPDTIYFSTNTATAGEILVVSITQKNVWYTERKRVASVPSGPLEPLTFTGAVSATYDGTHPLTIPIPQGGGSGNGGVVAVPFVKRDNSYYVHDTTDADHETSCYRSGNTVIVSCRIKCLTPNNTFWTTAVDNLPRQIGGEKIVSILSRSGFGPIRARINGNTLQLAGGEKTENYDLYDIYIVYFTEEVGK